MNFVSAALSLTDETPDFIILGFDTTLTYAKLWKLCDLVRAGVPYIATHPDYNCPTETGFMPDIGATIAFVKASAGREPDLVVGKPNRLLAEKAAERMGLPLSINVHDRRPPLYRYCARSHRGDSHHPCPERRNKSR